MTIERYRLRPEELAAIDAKIATMTPSEIATFCTTIETPSLLPDDSLPIAECVEWMAIYFRQSAVEAQEQLFEALRNGDLELEFPQ